MGAVRFVEGMTCGRKQNKDLKWQDAVVVSVPPAVALTSSAECKVKRYSGVGPSGCQN
jgi:hypothetical protein